MYATSMLQLTCYAISTGPHNFSRKTKVLGGIMIGVGLVITTSDTVLNSLLLSWWRKVHSLKSENKIVRLSTKMDVLSNQVLQEIRIKSNKKLMSKFFCAKGLDVIGLGNGYMRYGMSIGIPYTFTYDAQDEIDPNLLATLVPGELARKDWYETDQGRKLLEVVKLSEPAKKFAIACELHYLDSPESILRAVISAVAYGVTVLGFDRFQGPVKLYTGLIGQILLLGILAFASVALYCILAEFTNEKLRNRADRKTVYNIKEDYRRGAVEYYEKLIERNKQLRRLLKDGTSMYGEDGDKLAWYGFSFSSLESRLSSVREQVEKLDSQPNPEI